MSLLGDGRRVVRVLPDVAAIDKEFDYLVPDGVEVRVGDVVRIQLQGRRVGAWVVAIDVEPEPGVALRPLAKVSGRGPSPELIELAGWAADRWVGRRAAFLRTAAPPGVARSLVSGGSRSAVEAPPVSSAVAEALTSERAVLRLGPGADRYPLVQRAGTLAAHAEGQALVLCPSLAEAQVLGRRLRRDGVATAVVAADRPGSSATGEWMSAASGRASVVVGARSAAWAPAPNLQHVLVLDEHDEVYQQEQAPTWHARDVAIERARRAGVPCMLVSPCPSLEALQWGELVVEERPAERAAWPRIDVVDQRDLDPALGPLFSPRLVDLLRSDKSVVCVLNRIGRARLLACTSCSTLARCGVCDAAVHQVDGAHGGEDGLGCGRCGTERPMVCLECGGHRFKNLRLGVSRAREELEALAGRPVAELTAATPAGDLDSRAARVVVGTEAVLHRTRWADAVAFLDFDQELLALRYRAAEEAMALLVRAARLVQRTAARSGAEGADRRGLVVVQTRTPDHPVLTAAHLADPGRLVASELPMRQALGLPPATAMAAVSGAAAPEFMGAFGDPAGFRVQGPLDGAWRIIAPDHSSLSEALRAVPRPPGRLRIAVDPLRL